MEFQARGVLPIATAMRTMSHIPYTPAPDIVHEAAGHAPMLILPVYAQYLRNYAEVARRAVISREDVALYEAIRVLSDVKEQPTSTGEEIEQAEGRVRRGQARRQFRFRRAAALAASLVDGGIWIDRFARRTEDFRCRASVFHR